MKKLLKKYIDPLIPLYSVIPLIACFVLNWVFYYGAGIINRGRYHYDLTTNLDRMIPVVPAFVLVYFGCYIFWVLNSIMIMRISRSQCIRYAFAFISSLAIAGVIFVILPTSNSRPVISGTGIFDRLLVFLYWFDKPVNLFPSLHCLISWLNYIGMRGRKEIAFSYRLFSFILAIAVFATTQLTKQHFLVDIAGAVVIGELMYFVGDKIKDKPFMVKSLDWCEKILS